MMDQYFRKMINDAIESSNGAYRHDEKTEFIMIACCNALRWIAEELHVMNERRKRG